MLKKEGKGKKSKASQPLENTEIEQLWISGALGSSSSEVLQDTVRSPVPAHGNEGT